MKTHNVGTSCLQMLVASLLLLSASFALGQEDSGASLTVGAIKDKVESSAVRVLAKYGDSLGVTDKLVPKEISGDRGLFYTVSRQLTVDTTDAGNFGGVSLRYGLKRYDIGMKTDPDAPPRPDGKPVVKFDGDKWMHIVPILFGADTDRNFKNHDYLVEAGYIPAQYRSGDSCFKIGANPIVGLSAQLGRRVRGLEATAAGQPPEPSGSLRRLKLEGKLDFPLSCIFKTPGNADQTTLDIPALLFSDIGRWQVIVSSTGWRDFVEDRTYRKHELTVRIPTGAKTSIDLRRDIGAAPTNFDTGAKFSANLTIGF